MRYLKSFLYTHAWALWRFFVPVLCGYCKKFLLQWAPLCDECKAKIIPVVSQKIDITPSVSLTVFALSDYSDPIKRLILEKHWSLITASDSLGHLLWEMTPLSTHHYDLIIPVPLHWSRYAARGFNQAEEIARVIAQKSGKPLVKVLKRNRKTAFQHVLPSSVRMENVKGAFSINKKIKEQYKNKHLLIIDDVMTTGATLRAIGKELLVLKPQSITVVVAARVI